MWVRTLVEAGQAGTPRSVTRARTFATARSLRQNTPSSSENHVDVEKLLATPTWSVASLLPPQDHVDATTSITPKQLHHLLRLSALPPPKDEREEQEMIQTLASQLHFVKEIQRVDTTGVEPFRSLRDETAEGEKQAELGLDALKDALAREEVRGKHHKRIRRRRERPDRAEKDSWNALDTASRKAGRYFVVDGGKGK